MSDFRCGSPGVAWESDRQKWRRLAQEAEIDADRLAVELRRDGHEPGGSTIWPHHPECTGCAALAAHDAARTKEGL